MSRVTISAAAAVLAAVLLSGCATSGTMTAGLPTRVSDASTNPASPAPAATKTAAPDPGSQPDPDYGDALSIVRGRVTAKASGAAIDITMTVHPPAGAKSPAGQKLMAEAQAECWGKDNSWPTDAGSAVFTPIDVVVTQVAGTPAWPKSQAVGLLGYTSHSLVTGSATTQPRTQSGKLAMCYPASFSSIVGPGTSRVLAFETAKGAFAPLDGNSAFTVAEHGFFTDIGASSADMQSTIGGCETVITPAGRAFVDAAPYSWVDYPAYAAKAKFDACGVGIPSEKIPY